MRTAGTILWAAAASLAGPGFSAAPVSADEIVLRPTARVAPGTDATLADIADLSGARAQSLGTTIVVPASELGAGWVNVNTDRVKTVLETHNYVAWGVVALRGSTCSVGIAAAPDRPKSVAAKPAGPAGEPADGIGIETVKGYIAARIAAALGTEPARLRLAFDDRDSDVLSMPTDGRVIEVRLTGTSDRMPVRVTVFEGEKQLVSRSVGVGTLVYRQIAVATRAMRRGELIGAADISTEQRWVGPSLAPLPPDEAAGSAAKAPLDAGQIVTAGDVQAPVVIKRGDIVTVTSLAGGVMVRTTARARNAARDGEPVDLESLEPDHKHRRTFTARASGRGLAVVAAPADGNGTDAENKR